MVSNFFFQLSGIIFIFALIKIYFSKERFVSAGNNIYIKIMIVSLINLLLDMLTVYVVLQYGEDSLISIISIKAYLCSILVWLILLTTYIYVVSFKKTEKFSLAKVSSLLKILKVLIPIGLIGLIAIIYLPIDLMAKYNVIYFTGQGIYFLYGFILFFVFVWFIRYIRRYHYIKSNNSKIILLILISVLLGIIINFIWPQFIFFNFIMYFTTFMMYFGIDNPDLKLMCELNAAKKQVEEVEVSKKDSLIKVSHEIRTPLNTIAGFSQSILEGNSEDTTEDVKHIKEASEHLLNLVNNILDVSDVDMEMYKLVFDDYNVENLMKQIVALAQTKMKSKKVDLNIIIDDNIPPFLFGDSIRIKEIVLNVICNAIKHTKVGYISLSIGCITVGNVCRLMITVKDTGIGISEDKLEKIFEEKASDNRQLVEDVININLATIKKIVESMKGEITIESEYREGTTVTITLDQKIGKNPLPEDISLTSTDIEKIQFTDKRILIVDDNKINLKVATRLLNRYNVIIDELTNGYQCVEKIKNGEKYDLIFLDDWMPNMSGVETLKQLKMIEGFDTPVVALTANANSGMKEKYIRDGFNDFIPKPVERKELNRVMKKFLSNR